MLLKVTAAVMVAVALIASVVLAFVLLEAVAVVAFALVAALVVTCLTFETEALLVFALVAIAVLAFAVDAAAEGRVVGAVSDADEVFLALHFLTLVVEADVAVGFTEALVDAPPATGAKAGWTTDDTGLMAAVEVAFAAEDDAMLLFVGDVLVAALAETEEVRAEVDVAPAGLAEAEVALTAVVLAAAAFVEVELINLATVGKLGLWLPSLRAR